MEISEIDESLENRIKAIEAKIKMTLAEFVESRIREIESEEGKPFNQIIQDVVKNHTPKSQAQPDIHTILLDNGWFLWGIDTNKIQE